MWGTSFENLTEDDDLQWTQRFIFDWRIGRKIFPSYDTSDT